MALSYSNLFTDLGKAVKTINALASTQTGLATQRAEIEDAFESHSLMAACTDLLANTTIAQRAIQTYREALLAICTNRLSDNTTVLSQIGVISTDINVILAGLIRQMNTDSATVDASVVTVGSVTAASGNTGNGTVVISKVLDGYSAPSTVHAAQVAYAELDSQLAVPETMRVRCTADSYTDGLTAAQEKFIIEGTAQSSNLAEPELGSGVGPNVYTAIKNTVVTNGTFETFTVANTPDSWTIASGTAGTHVFSEGTNFYRGVKALKLLGTGAQASIKLTQAISSMTPRRRYVVSFRYKASATDTSSQTFAVKFEGTGYTAGSTAKSEILGDVLATSWTLVTFTVMVPAARPSDWALTINFSGTPANGKIIYIDDVIVAPMVWHNGLGFAVIPGATPFVRNDSFTSAITNNAAGVFQEFFRRNYKVQLPSDNAAGETIDDALAV